MVLATNAECARRFGGRESWLIVKGDGRGLSTPPRNIVRFGNSDNRYDV